MSPPAASNAATTLARDASAIAPEGRALSTRYLLGIARLIADCRSESREVVLVSSGAVAAGRAVLGIEPGDIIRTSHSSQF